MQNVAIIPAAGVGKRFGASQPKQYTTIVGIPVLVHTLQLFQQCDLIDAIVVGVAAEYHESMQHLVRDYALNKVSDILIGGAERQDTVSAALSSSAARRAEIVLVHDAVRPCAGQDLIRRVIAAARKHDAAVPGIPLNDTVKELDADGFVLRTPERSRLRAVQTPQGFSRSLLQAALEHVSRHAIAVTDDASAVETLGHKVAMIEGEPANIKLTTPSDRDRIERYLKAEAAERSD